jgi:hypothetical protein
MRSAGGLAALPAALLGSPAEPVDEQQLLMPTAIDVPMFAGDLSLHVPSRKKRTTNLFYRI